MTLKPKHCLVCRKAFSPNYRTPTQNICSRVQCQKERKRRKWRRWATGHGKQRRDKLRLWAQAYPHYWRHYRSNKAKAAYLEREIQRMRSKRKALRRVAKQTHFKTLPDFGGTP